MQELSGRVVPGVGVRAVDDTLVRQRALETLRPSHAMEAL